MEYSFLSIKRPSDDIPWLETKSSEAAAWAGEHL